jgi:hypothetical protein
VTSETAPPTSAASDHHRTEREAHSSAADQRHTCASLPLAQNVPARVVMEILGHSQLARSTDLYSHVMPTALCSRGRYGSRPLFNRTEPRCCQWGYLGASRSAMGLEIGG